MTAAEPLHSRREQRRGPRRPIPGAVIVAAAIVVAAVVAWQIVAVANARSLAQKEPEQALSWRPDDPRALGYLAEREFTDASASGRPPDAT